MHTALSQRYKRNQIDQALAQVDPGRREGKPNPVLSSNIKRLLDGDRSTPLTDAIWAKDGFAFYDDVAPGHGAEVGYRAYHAFALLIGVRLLEGGVAPRWTIFLLRRVRPDLEREFERLAATLPDFFQHGRRLSDAQADREIQDGFIVSEPEKMSFLIEITGPFGSSSFSEARGDGSTSSIVDYATLALRLRAVSHEARVATLMELSNPAYQLLYFLPRTVVKKRGRQ